MGVIIDVLFNDDVDMLFIGGELLFVYNGLRAKGIDSLLLMLIFSLLFSNNKDVLLLLLLLLLFPLILLLLFPLSIMTNNGSLANSVAITLLMCSLNLPYSLYIVLILTYNFTIISFLSLTYFINPPYFFYNKLISIFNLFTYYLDWLTSIDLIYMIFYCLASYVCNFV